MNQEERFPILPFITAFFVTVLVLTPSASSKFIELGPFTIVGSTLFFPISYFFNDVLTEVYGFEKSRKIIWTGFAAQLFTALIYVLIQYLPAPAFWTHQQAYDVILGQAPRIVLASLSAYFFGEFMNSFVLSKLKYFAQGKTGFHLAVRFVLSTFVGEFFDSAIFISVAFWGTMENAKLLQIIVTIWLLKTAYEIVTLPISLPLVRWIKRREGIDHIDQPKATNYSPFKI